MLFKKFLLAASITTGLVLCSSVLTFADVTVKIGNDTLETDQPPVIVEGRTLVPFRAIYEGLGAEVEWNDATREATGKRGETTVTMTIDKPEMQVNGETIALDVPAKIINDRTMVPIRAVSDGLDETVDWDPISKTVQITTSYVSLDTDEDAMDDVNPGWLAESGLAYTNGYDPAEPYFIKSDRYNLDENGNKIWQDLETNIMVKLINVNEGEAAKNIAIDQGVLDVEKMENKVKELFGSAKWISLEWETASVEEFEGYYPYVWNCMDADFDLRKNDGGVDHFEDGISYIDSTDIIYNNKPYEIAYTTRDHVAALCIPADYDNLIFWMAGADEESYDGRMATHDYVFSPIANQIDGRVAIWLPLKK